MTTADSVRQFVSAALPETQHWTARPSVADLSTLPSTPALYLLTDADDRPIQLATTQSLRRQLLARLAERQRPRSARADVAEIARGVRWRPLAAPFDGRWWYYRVARIMYPDEYRRMISFGPAYFLHVDWEAGVPEVRVAERVWCLSGEFVGPWPAHAAGQKALDGLCDLFDLCRYPEQVRKAPRGTRCAYAELGRCDAPCDGSVPLAPYIERCRAAWGFALGGATAWIEEAARRMHQAASEQRYELAAQLRNQLAFARQWQSHWQPVVRPLALLDYVLGVRVTRRRAWKVYVFRAGVVGEGPVIRARGGATVAADWVLTQLACDPPTAEPIERMEQTWLVCHLLQRCAAEHVWAIPLAEAAPGTLAEAIARRAAAVERDFGPSADG